jgi:hypothetical protein
MSSDTEHMIYSVVADTWHQRRMPLQVVAHSQPPAGARFSESRTVKSSLITTAALAFFYVDFWTTFDPMYKPLLIPSSV